MVLQFPYGIWQDFLVSITEHPIPM
jgi:hypothetical protein